MRDMATLTSSTVSDHGCFTGTFEFSDSYQDGAIELTNPLSHTLEDFYLKTDLESMLIKLSSPPSDWERFKSMMEDHAQYVVQRQIVSNHPKVVPSYAIF